jgi:hypothetical protein
MTIPCSVYDGRDRVGSVARSGDRYVAFDPSGKKLGQFRTQVEAVAAVLDAAKSPHSPTSKIGAAQ